mmetsp:Transcript_4342/g.10465  ORF Transcript_4342/g.10465 Transcript_4342/m.10465 type:complete len:237 (-) Transcript_4342:207-917(-)
MKRSTRYGSRPGPFNVLGRRSTGSFKRFAPAAAVAKQKRSLSSSGIKLWKFSPIAFKPTMSSSLQSLRSTDLPSAASQQEASQTIANTFSIAFFSMTESCCKRNMNCHSACWKMMTMQPTMEPTKKRICSTIAASYDQVDVQSAMIACMIKLMMPKERKRIQRQVEYNKKEDKSNWLCILTRMLVSSKIVKQSNISREFGENNLKHNAPKANNCTNVSGSATQATPCSSSRRAKKG